MVAENPAQVAAAFASADGAFRLTAPGGQSEIYVNPTPVAYWSDAEAGTEPPQDEPVPGGREPVTNIWGQPLRRKPRR